MQRIIAAPKVATLLGEGEWAAPAYADLAARLRRAAIDGRLPAGTRLPSERDLTSAVGLSRTTVTRAYTELREQGYLRTRQGSGSVVYLPDVPGGRVDHLLAPHQPLEDAIDLSCTAAPAPPGLMEAYEAAMRHVDGYLPGTGYYPSGLPALRERIAQRYRDRGLPTETDQILITNGALASAAIAVQAMLATGDRVVVESPTYPNVISTFASVRARLVPHPVEIGMDEAGSNGPGSNGPAREWDPDGFATLLRQVGARAAYMIPDFQNPTGLLMRDEQREQVGAALTRNRVVPIIDESAADLSLDFPPEQMPRPLAAYVPDSVTVGSVSKQFWCGLRIGWMRVPKERVQQMATSRLRMDLGAPVLEQLVVLELLDREQEIATPHRKELRQARDQLRAGLVEHLPSWQINSPSGGLSLWCSLPEARSTALAVAARRHGVELTTGPTFAPAGGFDSRMRVPYALGAQALESVPARLALAWEEALADDVVGAPISDRRVIA